MEEKKETPYYLVREMEMRNNYDGFRKALDEIWPHSVIAYSVKTNSLPWVLKRMKAYGAYAEVVSDDEYQLALLCGFEKNRIIFNGPAKSREYLISAVEGGSVVNVDSEDELRCLQAGRPFPRGKIGIRVNPDPTVFNRTDIGFEEDGFRFGFAEQNGEFQRAAEQVKGIYPEMEAGLHLHVNSVTRSIGVYRSIARYAADLICKYGFHPSYIDIGGGFFGGVPGKPTPGEYIRVIRDELESAVDISATTLIIEPGSALIGSAVELHTTVTDVKDSACSRIVTTDGSRLHIDPLWQKKRYLFSTDSCKAPHPRQIVCGYTCMDHDRIMILENQPELSPGDSIVYHRVGNYTVTFSGPFIRPIPPVWAEYEGRTELIRKRMSMEEIYRMEMV